MSERESEGQQRRYCRNCGTEAVPGNAFCVSCGERLAPGSEDTWQATRSSASGQRSPTLTALREAFRGVAGRFGRPSGLKWGVVAVASLVLAFVAIGVPSALYGAGPLGSPEPGTGDESKAAEEGPVEEEVDGYQAGAVLPEEGGYEGEEVSPCDAVAPELKGLAERWSSFDRGYGPLFLPSYLPFSVERVADWKETFRLYEIWGENTTLALDYIEDSIYRSDMPDDLAYVQTMTTDNGLTYYYFVEAEGAATGTYSVWFGEMSEEGPVRLSYRLRADYSTMTPEEFGEIFRSMVKVDTSGGEAC